MNRRKHDEVRKWLVKQNLKRAEDDAKGRKRPKKDPSKRYAELFGNARNASIGNLQNIAARSKYLPARYGRESSKKLHHEQAKQVLGNYYESRTMAEILRDKKRQAAAVDAGRRRLPSEYQNIISSSDDDDILGTRPPPEARKRKDPVVLKRKIEKPLILMPTGSVYEAKYLHKPTAALGRPDKISGVRTEYEEAPKYNFFQSRLEKLNERKRDMEPLRRPPLEPPEMSPDFDFPPAAARAEKLETPRDDIEMPDFHCHNDDDDRRYKRSKVANFDRRQKDDFLPTRLNEDKNRGGRVLARCDNTPNLPPPPAAPSFPFGEPSTSGSNLFNKLTHNNPREVEKHNAHTCPAETGNSDEEWDVSDDDGYGDKLGTTKEWLSGMISHLKGLHMEEPRKQILEGPSAVNIKIKSARLKEVARRNGIILTKEFVEEQWRKRHNGERPPPTVVRDNYDDLVLTDTSDDEPTKMSKRYN